MRKIFWLAVIIAAFFVSSFAQKIPDVDNLKQVSQLPADIPQRITGMAFDGEKLWFSVYLSKGHYATFEPKSESWKYSRDENQHQLIRQISQPYSSSSGLAFDGKTLWFGGSYGESFGSINTENWQIEKHFTKKVRNDISGSQSYSSLAFDGTNIWAAWHSSNWRLPNSEIQRLVKINPESGEIIETYDLPAGNKRDITHGLTFDGENLWHIKDKKLSAIGLDGKLKTQVSLENVNRPSGLAWDGQSLWIVEFYGKLWRLPLKDSKNI